MWASNQQQDILIDWKKMQGRMLTWKSDFPGIWEVYGQSVAESLQRSIHEYSNCEKRLSALLQCSV